MKLQGKKQFKSMSTFSCDHCGQLVLKNNNYYALYFEFYPKQKVEYKFDNDKKWSDEYPSMMHESVCVSCGNKVK